MRLRQAGAAIVAGLALASCTVEVVVDGKACPCGDEYQCDEFEDVCKQELCAVSADELVVAWATPHTLAFEWNPTGEQSDFHQYELVVATSREAALEGTGDARIQTLTQNPALEVLNDNGDQPMFTLVADLTPGTEYFARLRITDNNTCVSQSQIVVESTPTVPVKPIVLFDNDTDVTGVQPDDLATLVGSGPEAYIEYQLALDSGCTRDGFCGQPVKADFAAKRVGEDGGPENYVEGGEFDQAYLEVVLFYDAVVSADTATVFISPAWPEGSPETGNFRFDVPSFSLEPSSGYHSIEVPLRRLHLSEGSFRDLTHGDLVDLELTQAAIGAQWHEASVVRVDAFRIHH